jgi:imidazolonepropionase-like amidohydrolase
MARDLIASRPTWCTCVAVILLLLGGCATPPAAAPVPAPFPAPVHAPAEAPGTEESTDEGESPAADASDVTAIVGVNVVPMDTERVLPDHTVLIRGDRIVAIGPSSDVALPREARVVDGEGRWLMPGLADMHVHLWNADHLTLFLANGVTLVRNMWGSPMQLGMRASLADGRLFGPELITAGPLMDGRPPIWQGSTVVDSVEDAHTYVGQVARAGFDLIKVYNHLTPEVYAALVDAAQENDIPVGGHVPDAVGLDGVLATGQHTIEHLSGYLDALAKPGQDGQMGGWTGDPDALDEEAIRELARRTVQAGTWNCITLIVLTRLVPAAEAAALLETPPMRYMDDNTLAGWDPTRDFRTKSMTADDYTKLRKGDAARKKIVKVLYEEGAPILLGTDTPNPFVVPGFSIHQELALLVESGLSPFDALAAGTRDAARSLGQEQLFGTVAVGRRADLLLLEADPLQDVAAANRRVGVFRLGVYYAEAELQERLETIAQRLR